MSKISDLLITMQERCWECPAFEENFDIGNCSIIEAPIPIQCPSESRTLYKHGALYFYKHNNRIKCWLGSPKQHSSRLLFDIPISYIKDIEKGLTDIVDQIKQEEEYAKLV